MLKIIRSKITFKLLIAIINIFMILLLIISLYISSYFNKSYSEKTISNSKALLESTLNNIDEKINRFILTSTLLVTDKSIRTLINQDRKYSEEIVSNQNVTYVNETDRYVTAKEFCYNLEILDADICSSTLITNRDVYLNYTGTEIYNPKFKNQYSDMYWYKKSFEMKGAPLLISRHIPFQTTGTNLQVISVARSLFDAATNKYLATLLVDIDVLKIKSLLMQMQGDEGRFMLLIDEDGKIICSGQEDIQHEKAISVLELNDRKSDTLQYKTTTGEKYIFNYITSYSTGWRLGQVISMEFLMKESRKSTLLFVQGMSIIIIVIMIIAAFNLVYLVSRPIKKLNKRINKIGMGDLSDYDNKYKNRQDEIGQLSRSIYQIKDNLKDMILKVATTLNGQRDAQLKALQCQINPHFILNTLNSIQMMAKIDKADNVVYMLENLGSLFKSYISKDQVLVSIREEAKSIATYMNLQKMRHKDKIIYKNQLPNDILDYYCIKFIVQPIIENAISHGIETRKKGGTICLGGKYLDEKHILLYVEDDGAGMDEEILALLINKLEDENSTAIDTDNGIGLQNVHNRLRLYYGNDYGIKIKSQMGFGTRVDITIPVIKDADSKML